MLAAIGSRITVATSDDPAFLTNLRQRGYVLVLDARAVGCLPPDTLRSL